MTSTSVQQPSTAFALRDCALISRTTGVRAQTLKEFREGLQRVPPGCIDHHFSGRLLRPQFDEPEYNNDFASWASRGLHDKALAERLSMVVPSDFEDSESLRREILEIVDQRLEESEFIPWSSADRRFQFLQAQMVVFDTGMRLERPQDLAPVLPSLSTGSVFYHFIDARSRTVTRCNDFSAWMEGLGGDYAELARRLNRLDPYFSSLKEIRVMISRTVQNFFEERA